MAPRLRALKDSYGLICHMKLYTRQLTLTMKIIIIIIILRSDLCQIKLDWHELILSILVSFVNNNNDCGFDVVDQTKPLQDNFDSRICSVLCTMLHGGIHIAIIHCNALLNRNECKFFSSSSN